MRTTVVRAARLLAGLLGVGTLALGGAVAAPASAATAPACQVTYTVTNSWAGGFQGSIDITNNMAAVTSWTLGFSFSGNQMVNNGWNGTWTQTGQAVTVASASWNGSVATGATVNVGFVANSTGTNTNPSAFTFNGTACNGGTGTNSPTVSITSPTAGQTFAAPATIPITATASETGGTISKVEFFDGTLLLGTATTSPFTFTWTNVAAGTYQLTAQAFDANGVMSASTAVPITVTGGGGTGVAPQLHVSGNKLVDAKGNTVVLHGVNRSGGEFACVQGNGLWDGPMDQTSVTAIKSWHVTAVRVPLNEACWNAESYVMPQFAGSTYQNAVKTYVNLLNSNGIVAILDLHWTDGAYTGNSAGSCPNTNPPTLQEALCQKPMPDAAQAIPFWTSVAQTFKGNDAVIFDLFNEPFASRATGSDASGWTCWRDGGTCAGIGYQVAGMQSMVNAVRSAGANNVLMLGGEEFSNEMTSWLQFKPTDPDNNLVAAWHSYNFNTCSNMSCWTSQVAPVIAAVPLVTGEFGENDCSTGYVNQLMPWLDSQGASYLAWTWNAWDCSSGPSLISDYTGTATAYGAGVKAHFATLP